MFLPRPHEQCVRPMMLPDVDGARMPVVGQRRAGRHQLYPFGERLVPEDEAVMHVVGSGSTVRCGRQPEAPAHCRNRWRDNEASGSKCPVGGI